MEHPRLGRRSRRNGEVKQWQVVHGRARRQGPDFITTPWWFYKRRGRQTIASRTSQMDHLERKGTGRLRFVSQQAVMPPLRLRRLSLGML